MDIELLPRRYPRQYSGDWAEQDVVSGRYDVVSPQQSSETLSKSYEKPGVEERSHLVSTDKPRIDGTRHDYGDDGSLPAKSFSITSRRRRIWRHIWVALLAFLLLIITFPYMGVKLATNECGYDGSSPYQGQTLFVIDEAFGTFSFPLAKFIDVAWDLIVGRGGQALFGWTSYRVCTDCLMWIMETSPVSYDLYTGLTFSWTSLASLSPIPKYVWTRNRFAHKIVIVLLAIDIVWVAIYPTIMSAMTGYISNNDLNVRLKDGKYLSWTDFFNTDPIYECAGRRSCVAAFGNTTFRKDGPDTALWEEVTKQYASRNYPADKYVFYSFRNGSRTDYVKFAMYYPIDNYTYDYYYTEEPGVIQCIANQTYRWGFSTTFVYIAAAGNTIWVLSTYSLWVHVNRKSELCKKGRRLGKYRAAMDMAEIAGEDLGPNISAYNDEELEKALRRRPPIKYAVLPPTGENCTEGRPAHIGLSRAKQGGAVKLSFGQTYG